tara:strand:+ start:561 stop:1031 length:471 start_codon:yes stop_codon:yes gene_type:complete
MTVLVVRNIENTELDLAVDICEAGVEETRLGVEFDRENARNWIWSYMQSAVTDVLVADVDGELVGGVMLAESHEMFTRPMCYMAKFWVLPAGRRTRAARELMRSTVAWANSRDCSHIYVTATADLDEREQRLFINLMKRTGFQEKGPVLSKQLVKD